MAPLGIINVVELAFSVMFIFLMIWSLANYLYVSFEHLHMDKPGVQVYVSSFQDSRILLLLNLKLSNSPASFASVLLTSREGKIKLSRTEPNRDRIIMFPLLLFDKRRKYDNIKDVTKMKLI